jgi:hypothetical protein
MGSITIRTDWNLPTFSYLAGPIICPRTRIIGQSDPGSSIVQLLRHSLVRGRTSRPSAVNRRGTHTSASADILVSRSASEPARVIVFSTGSFCIHTIGLICCGQLQRTITTQAGPFTRHWTCSRAGQRRRCQLARALLSNNG